jgi:hypothetical protein
VIVPRYVPHVFEQSEGVVRDFGGVVFGVLSRVQERGRIDDLSQVKVVLLCPDTRAGYRGGHARSLGMLVCELVCREALGGCRQEIVGWRLRLCVLKCRKCAVEPALGNVCKKVPCREVQGPELGRLGVSMYRDRLRYVSGVCVSFGVAAVFREVEECV